MFFSFFLLGSFSLGWRTFYGCFMDFLEQWSLEAPLVLHPPPPFSSRPVIQLYGRSSLFGQSFSLIWYVWLHCLAGRWGSFPSPPTDFLGVRSGETSTLFPPGYLYDVSRSSFFGQGTFFPAVVDNGVPATGFLVFL